MGEYGGHFYRITREKRRTRLLYSGFLPFEARDLSRVPLSVPYMRNLISDRLRAYKWAIEQKWSKTQWQNYVKKDIYNGDLDAWRLLRNYESAWKQNASPNDPYLLLQQKKRSEQKRQYRALHKGRIDEQKRRYRELHKDQIRKYSKDYRLRRKAKSEH